jgi:hypothetical protein
MTPADPGRFARAHSVTPYRRAISTTVVLAIGFAGTLAPVHGQSSGSFATSRWYGTIRDARSGRGAGSLDFADGVFRAVFAAAGVNTGGAIADERDDSASTTSFVLRSSADPSCVYAVTARIGTSGELLGDYRGCGNDAGTFVFHRIANWGGEIKLLPPRHTAAGEPGCRDA